jgi:hypothetical protein
MHSFGQNRYDVTRRRNFRILFPTLKKISVLILQLVYAPFVVSVDTDSHSGLWAQIGICNPQSANICLPVLLGVERAGALLIAPARTPPAEHRQQV